MAAYLIWPGGWVSRTEAWNYTTEESDEFTSRGLTKPSPHATPCHSSSRVPLFSPSEMAPGAVATGAGFPVCLLHLQKIREISLGVSDWWSLLGWPHSSSNFEKVELQRRHFPKRQRKANWKIMGTSLVVQGLIHLPVHGMWVRSLVA